jgi:hypothetical protein
VAIRTDCAHTAAIRVVNGLLVFLKHVFSHLVTADAEFQFVGRIHTGVESAPEQDTQVKTDKSDGQNGILGTGFPQKDPGLIKDAWMISHVFHSWSHLKLKNSCAFFVEPSRATAKQNG